MLKHAEDRRSKIPNRLQLLRYVLVVVVALSNIVGFLPDSLQASKHFALRHRHDPAAHEVQAEPLHDPIMRERLLSSCEQQSAGKVQCRVIGTGQGIPQERFAELDLGRPVRFVASRQLMGNERANITRHTGTPSRSISRASRLPLCLRVSSAS